MWESSLHHAFQPADVYIAYQCLMQSSRPCNGLGRNNCLIGVSTTLVPFKVSRIYALDAHTCLVPFGQA